ncbi:YARHG domain-containing protein [Dysgonomonas sp. OttesenSCG-928-M03]|nr:YARHG domain-containing protein [Dysgonomonas sp. OttesenSCG-928-M03]
MKRILFCLFLLFLICGISANDGSYYIDGNQLIPIVEADISVKKEILEIKRSKTNDRQVEVLVYYEFYNSGNPKTILVGFEARSPYGDTDSSPKDGEHPNMYHFTIDMNGNKLPYQVDIVNDSLYFQDGKFKSLSSKEIKENTGEGWADFMYVYHFQANFKKGLNIIKHTYTCDLSGSVMATYEFGYILSAAMRWGNKQIDDFTLHIDMGTDQLINIPQTFFNNTDEWTIAGTGRKQDTGNPYFFSDTDSNEPPTTSQFFIKNGYLIFQKKNFKPKGELFIYSPLGYTDLDNFNYLNMPYIDHNIMYSRYYEEDKVEDEISKKVLRNLPFAKRGYIFSTPELQKYFESQIWYFPDSTYKSDTSKLPQEEQKWVRYWSQ